MGRRRVLMDMTMTAKWRRAGVMVGIVRASTELYEGLKQLTDVEMVQLMPPESEGGEPRIRAIDPETLEVTERVIAPEAGDLFLMAEIQIRGIHVPMNHPWPGYLARYGVDRCAVIYDILPIEMPECFEPGTAREMPAYVLKIFRNYNRIICDSEAVMRSLERFRNEGTIPPCRLELDFADDNTLFTHLAEGWSRKDGGARGGNGAAIAFCTGVNDGDLVLHCVCESEPGTGETRVILNGYDTGVIPEKPIHAENFMLPAGALREERQEIRLYTDNPQGGVRLFEAGIYAAEPGETPVKDRAEEDVKLGFAHLGVKTGRRAADGTPDEAVARFMPEGRKEAVFLMVGTMEPRKGYELALGAFERLWAEGAEDKLCIIGNAGWNMQAFTERLRTHPEKGKRLLVLEGATDATLGEAYRRADALVQASAGEGFGLPLIEAGSRGIPVLCSDIPVFHEVGGEHVMYFRRTEEDLVRCIRQFEENRGTGAIPDAKKIAGRSWADYAKECYALMTGEQEWPVTLKGTRKEKAPARKKAVVATTYPIWPPTGGGQARVYGLYREMAKEYDIELICLGPIIARATKRIIAPGLTEQVIPKTAAHEEQEAELSRQAGVAVTDTGLMLWSELTPAYGEALRRAGEEADLFIACHPYAWPLIHALYPDRPVLYEAQDVEWAIKKEMYRENEETAGVLEKLKETEAACCADSRLIMTCSEEDKAKLAELYGTDEAKILVVPNGVDTKKIRYTGVEERLRRKKRAGLEKEKIGIFMGSWHEPNLEAARAVMRAAGKCGGAKLYLMGSQCRYFEDKELPENVALMGLVSEAEKQRVFSMADFALNPIISGSGTNLKMFDYMAAGIPVITTRFGMRGIGREDVVILAENEELAEAIRAFDLPACAERVEKARKYVEDVFDWKVIAESVLRRLKEPGTNQNRK